MPGAPALHQARLPRRDDGPGRPGRDVTRHQSGRDQRVQPTGFQQPRTDQFQVGEDPGRGVRQDGQRGEAVARGAGGDPQCRARAVRRPGRFQDEPVPGTAPQGDGAAVPSLGTQQDLRLCRPAARGAAESRRHQVRRLRVRQGPVAPGPYP